MVACGVTHESWGADIEKKYPEGRGGWGGAQATNWPHGGMLRRVLVQDCVVRNVVIVIS